MKTFGISLKLCTNYNICILILLLATATTTTVEMVVASEFIVSSFRIIYVQSRQYCQRDRLGLYQAILQSSRRTRRLVQVALNTLSTWWWWLVSRPISCYDLKLNVWETGGYVNIGVFSATPFLNISHTQHTTRSSAKKRRTLPRRPGLTLLTA